MKVLELNKNQQEAVNHINGPMLVLAGAGSGKTKVLTSRIANLIENGISPYNILAITFTNKAAKEMKDRVVSLIGSTANNIQISTFHSLGLRILKENYSLLGYERNFTIIDSDDVLTIIKKIMKEGKVFESKTIQDAFDINADEKSLPLNLDKTTVYYSSDFDMKELDKYLNSSSDMKLRIEDYTMKKNFTALDIVERMYSSNASKVIIAIWDLLDGVNKRTRELDLDEIKHKSETILKQYMVQFLR